MRMQPEISDLDIHPESNLCWVRDHCVRHIEMELPVICLRSCAAFDVVWTAYSSSKQTLWWTFPRRTAYSYRKNIDPFGTFVRSICLKNALQRQFSSPKVGYVTVYLQSPFQF